MPTPAPEIKSSNDNITQTKLDDPIELRNTNELVIALVGPVGAGVSTTAQHLKELLENDFNYEFAHILKVSELITSAHTNLGTAIPTSKNELDRIEILQKAGSTLRNDFGQSYLAEKAVESIAIHRTDNGGYEEVDGGQFVALSKRRAYIIDSLKHPREIEILEAVYGEIFWTFGVMAPEDIRKDRLLAIHSNPEVANKVITTDEEEGVEYGQKVRDTIQKADFFLRNDKANTDNLNASISRCLKLIFGTEIITPKLAETAMYNAATAAVGSACLSRQVGAVIYSSNGELIGKGRNDVPKFNGGLYRSEDEDKDHRCHKWKTKICHNDHRKDGLYEAIYNELEHTLIAGVSKEDVKKALKNTDIKNLIEYSRAVHAEMDAIISVGRGNKTGLLGSTLYCTTFPCHNCARHIIASGINEVIYIEPYPKSLALSLHEDAISTTHETIDKVRFIQYEGVSPKNMLRLFESRGNRKENGKFTPTNPKEASPTSRSALDGFTQREHIIVMKIKDAEDNYKAPPEG